MNTKTVVLALLLLLLLASQADSTGSGSGHAIVYTREQLLALCGAGKLTGYRPDVPRELKRRRRGCRSGVMCRSKRKRFKPTLPAIITGNVRSICNKMDELAALTKHQREYQQCSMILFTETWLTELTPDSNATLDGFQLIRADRTRDSGKRKGGGLAVFVNDRWCNPGHITIKEKLCSVDIELLAISTRPYYLPRELSHVITIAVYVPPSANADSARDVLLSAVSRLQTQHPQALILITGDFNHAPPNRHIANIYSIYHLLH